MTMVGRQVVIGLLLSILLFLLISAGYLFAFPTDLSKLWERQVLDIPFIISVPSISVAIGLMFGFYSGLASKRELQSVDNLLHELEEGRHIDTVEMDTDLLEVESIHRRIGKIQKQMSEQVKLSQRLATEKVEGQRASN